MGASLALPLALFALASAVSWVSTNQTADREIERTLDVAHEHALKVFETIDRSLSEIAEITRGMPDAEISRREPALHLRLKEFVGSLPQVKSAWVFDARGHALVNSLVSPPPEIDFSDRDYFKAHVAADIGTHIGDALTPRPPYLGAAFFGVSRRRPTDDGSFSRRDPGFGTPGIFREFLRQDRPRPRQLLRARPDRRQRTGPLACPRPRSPRRSPGSSRHRRSPPVPRRDSSPRHRRPTGSSAGSVIKGLPPIRSMSAPGSRPRRSGRAGSPPWASIWSSACRPLRCCF